MRRDAVLRLCVLFDAGYHVTQCVTPFPRAFAINREHAVFHFNEPMVEGAWQGTQPKVKAS